PRSHIMCDVFRHPRHPTFFTAVAQTLLEFFDPVLAVDTREQRRHPLTIKIMQVASRLLNLSIEFFRFSVVARVDEGGHPFLWRISSREHLVERHAHSERTNQHPSKVRALAIAS